MKLKPFLILALTLSSLSAQKVFDSKAGKLVQEGSQLLDSNKFNEALAKFREAAKLDPTYSMAVSHQSLAFLQASTMTDEANVGDYRGAAEELARKALEINDLDPVAAAVLKQLSGGGFSSSHKPSKEALTFFQEAEAKFVAHSYNEAIALYRKALELDPAYTDAALYLGDAYFAQEKWEDAEPWFKKAAEMEPLYGRTWRFLFDCYGAMGRRRDAEGAAMSGLAAEPDNMNAWGRIRQIRKSLGEKELERFKWPVGGGAEIVEKDGKKEIQIRLNPQDEAVADRSFWMAYSLLRGAQKLGDPKKDPKAKPESPFEQERAALLMGFEGLENALAEGKLKIKDPSLAKLREIKKAGHLETALFLLHFQEAYRPDFEAWKKGNPTGIQVFLGLFPLKP
jgi:tetratricopeptide (TPR) repeat protein